MNHFKRLPLFFLTVWMVSLSACASVSIDDDKSYSKNNLTVSFPRLINISDPNQEQYSGGLDNYQIEHPVEISTEQVRNHLLSLWYKFSESSRPPEPVFTAQEIEELAPLFRAALNKVSPSQYIQFEYQGAGGMTEGEVFGSVDAVHWRLIRIRDLYFSKSFLGAGQDSWKLVRRTRKQRVHREKTTLGNLAQENWMVVDKDVPVTPREPKTARTEPPANRSVQKPVAKSQKTPPAPDPGLKQKLETLKQLLDQGLIDEKDYRMKKEELLRQHL